MSDKICPNCNSKINENSKFCPECGCSLENQNENVNQEKKQDFFSFTEDIASKIQNKLDNEDIFNTNEIKELIRNLDEESINKLLDKYGISPSRIKFLTLNKLFEKVDISKLKEDLVEFGIISPDSDIETVKAEVIVEEEDEETTTPDEEEKEATEAEVVEESAEEVEEPDEEDVVEESAEEVVEDEKETTEEEVVEESAEEESPDDDETVVSDEEVVEEPDEEDVVEEESQDEEETAAPEEDTTEEKPSDNPSICSECGFENRPNVKFCTKCGNKLI